MKVKTFILLLLVAVAITSGKISIDAFEQIMSAVSTVFIQTLNELLTLLVQVLQNYWPC